MEYLQINGIEKKVTRIAFGCAIAPMLAGENTHALGEEIWKLMDENLAKRDG